MSSWLSLLGPVRDRLPGPRLPSLRAVLFALTVILVMYALTGL